MAIAYVNFQLTDSTSFSYSVGTGSNRLLIIAFRDNAGTTASAVTFNGVSASLAVKKQNTTDTNVWTEMWYLNNPDSGSHTVAITGGSPRDVNVLEYTGVKNQAPEATGTSTAASGNALGNTLTTVTDNSIHVVHCASQNINTNGATGGTFRGSAGSSTPADDFPITPAASNTITMTRSGGTAGVMTTCGAAFAPAPDANTTNFFNMM